MTWRLENSRSFMLDKALHPAQVWIQGPVHPLGQRRSEQAQEPVGDAVGCEGTPRSDRRCRGFAPQSERQGLVTGLSPSMNGDGRSSCPLSTPRPRPTEHHPKRRTRSRPGSEHLRSEHFGIPSWLVPCVHDDVKDLLGRSRHVDHGDRRPGRAPPREPGGQTRWQSAVSTDGSSLRLLAWMTGVFLRELPSGKSGERRRRGCRRPVDGRKDRSRSVGF